MHKDVIQSSFDETRGNVILMSQYGQIMKSTINFCCGEATSKKVATCHHFYLKEDGNLVCFVDGIVVEGARAFSILLGINCLDKTEHGRIPSNVGVVIPEISESNKKLGIAYISFLITEAEKHFNSIKNKISIGSDIWMEISNFIYNSCLSLETFKEGFDDSQSLQKIVFGIQHRVFADLFHSAVEEALKGSNLSYKNDLGFLPKY